MSTNNNVQSVKIATVVFIGGLVGGYFFGDHQEQMRLKTNMTLLPDVDNSNCKMVLVIRSDVPMTPGKVCEQCAQATLGCYEIAVNRALPQLRAWKKQGQPKITLRAKNYEEILTLQHKAEQMNLVSQMVVDVKAKGTSGAVTVLAIGPGPADLVNKVTGHLSLY